MPELNQELQETILAGLVSMQIPEDEVDQRLRYGLRVLRDEWFTGIYAAMWRAVRQFYLNTGTIPEPGDFDELLAFRPELNLTRKAEYSESYKRLSELDVSFGRLKFSVTTLGERWRTTTFAEVMKTAQQINFGSVVDGDEARAGYADAMSYLADELPKIQRSEDEHFIEGSINQEASELWREYEEAKGGKRHGVLTGFDSFDYVTDGLHPGELMLLAGFSSEGKSKTACAIAYDAAFRQGRNVIFGSAEVSRNEVRRQLAVLHALKKYGPAITYTDVRNGTLDAAGEQIWQDALADLDNGSYGNFYIFSVPHRERIGYVEAKLKEKSRDFHVDLVVIDYLGLLSSNTRRTNRREELDDILVAAKRMATDADAGNGVAILSPWQISRSAWEQAKETGEYTKTALAETSQAERSPDIVVSLLRSELTPNKLKAQILKNRDGISGIDFELWSDFSRCHVSEEEPDSWSLD